MSRIRTIKPEFFRSESLAALPLAARMTFAGLWTEADDAGRGVANSKVLCGALWSLDDDVTAVDVEEHLQALAKEHIQMYEVDGKRYYAILNWENHQAASYRRGEPLYPPPPDDTSSREIVKNPAPIVLEHGREGNRREQGRDISRDVADDASFDQFWNVYPLRVAKDAARKAWPKALERSSFAEILTGAERYRDDPNRDQGFTKHPATWLNGGCWDDDPLPLRRSSAPARAPVADRNRDRIRSRLDRLDGAPAPSATPQLPKGSP